MPMLDWMIVLACAVAAAGGYRLGFVARVSSWVGIVAGAAIAVTLVLPPLLRNAADSPDVQRLGMYVLITLLGSLLGQIIGTIAGARLASVVPEKWRKADHTVGGGAGIVAVLVIVWLVTPTAADVPGWSSQMVRSSAIAQAIDRIAPPVPDPVRDVTNLVVSESFQPVIEGLQPNPDTGDPPQNSGLPADVEQSVKESVVKVEGVACRRTQNGSGFAVGPNLFVTNAHVVAGEDRTSIIAESGRRYSATVVAFDSARDIAIMRVNNFSPRPLEVIDAGRGDTGAVFGHPGGQSRVEVSPAAVDSKVNAIGRDLYEQRQTRRQVLVLSSQLRQGDSGGPLVDTRGRLMGIAFAIAPDNPNTAYALATSELKAVLENVGTTEVSTGRCVSG